MLRECLDLIICNPFKDGFRTAEIEADGARAPRLVALSLGPLNSYGVLKSFQRPLYVTKLLRQSFIFVTWRNKISRKTNVESVSGPNRDQT
jgi:hypothetical protein